VISQPIPKILNDRYELGEELGRGGMGAVYRAYDPTLEREVAVKILSELGLGIEGRERLLQEAKAIARLSHPNIVAVYDAGETGETPFIVMEMIKGESLHDRPPEDLPGVVEVAKQICTALEHAHSHHIVHRDLKPENVLIDREGNAKLMDFGIARSMASRFASESTAIGTVFYLAPEIALGQEYDGRADLYSLGVMLYELTTGGLPFVAGDPVAVISQHIHSSVIPPRAKKPEIPPLLDALIVQLMSKDPRARPASAAETLKLLARSDLLNPAAKDEREVLVLDRIVRGRFVGREQELSEARSLWNKAEAGEGQTLLISGEPGVGKTRLMRELSTHVEVSGGRTLIGACYAEGGAPYAPFAQILRRALHRNGHGVPEFVIADLLDVAPELKPYFPDILPNPPLRPEAEQQRLFENVVTFCSTLSEQKPLLLVLDDAHWADSGSLALMRHLSRRIRHKAILLVATYRETGIDEARPFREVLLDLNRERLARRIKLSRLTKEQTESLLAAIFEEEILPEFLEGIYRETEGNPFFIEEICKDLVESGKLYYQEGRWHRSSMDELELPQSVREVVQARISKLSPDDHDTLTLAAILGREFDFDTLLKASELEEDRLIDALEEAEKAQLISEVSGEGGATFSFAHALIPATLVESIRTLRRRKLHRQVAQAIETLRPEALEDLGYHYEEAGDDERARSYYAQAGERASHAFANQEAEGYFRAALALYPSNEPHPELLAELAVVLARRSNFDEALDSWKSAAALYGAAGKAARVAWCYARMSRAVWDAGDIPLGLELAEKGLEIVGDASESEEHADLLHELARAYFFNGMSEEGIPVSERALAMAKSTGNVRIQAEVLATQGLLYYGDSDKIDAAQAALQEAISLAETHQLITQELRARNNLSHILGPVRGDPRSAREQLARATELAREGGDVGMELFTGAHGALYGIYLGKLSEVEKELDRLDKLMEGLIKPGTGGTEVLKSHAVLEWARGHTLQLVETLRPIQVEVRESGDLQSLWEVNLHLAEAFVELSQFVEAEKAAQEVIELGGLDSATRGSGHLWNSIALSKRGEIEAAREMLQQAKESTPVELAAWHAVGVLRAEAQMAIAEARWSDAWSAFEEAVSRLNRMGMRIAHARVLRDWAEGHLLRGEPDDRKRARDLLKEARDAFDDMGSTAYVERIDSQLADLDGTQT
jgi:predicted ATPase